MKSFKRQLPPELEEFAKQFQVSSKAPDFQLPSEIEALYLEADRQRESAHAQAKADYEALFSLPFQDWLLELNLVQHFRSIWHGERLGDYHLYHDSSKALRQSWLFEVTDIRFGGRIGNLFDGLYLADKPQFLRKSDLPRVFILSAGFVHPQYRKTLVFYTAYQLKGKVIKHLEYDTNVNRGWAKRLAYHVDRGLKDNG